MEKLLEQAYLYDFYGELLTEHQKQVYEDFILQDLSLGEIAQEQGISRQGVHDLIKRCDKLLAGYEQKLHLVEKFLHIRNHVEEIQQIAEKLESGADPKMLKRLQAVSAEILEEL